MQNLLAKISLRHIQQNARLVSQVAKKPLVAVVKDDAYGHGLERVALALKEQVFAFAVSTVDEGASLRTAGIEQDVLVLTPPLTQEEVLRLSYYSLTASVTSLAVLHLCQRAKVSIKAHLAVNTGMNRFGVRCDRVAQACREAVKSGISFEGIYSHFYLAEDGEAREEQLRLFDKAYCTAREYFPKAIGHISATGGLLSGRYYDAVRSGIALYGYLPNGFEGALPVRPAARLYATVAHACQQLGEGAGYARIADTGSLYTLRVGYGDGLFRAGGTGNLGKLCMDAAVFRGNARVGRLRQIVPDVTFYAHANGTTEYEALLRLMQKAVKVYEG